jgi:hypothetical protein
LYDDVVECPATNESPIFLQGQRRRIWRASGWTHRNGRGKPGGKPGAVIFRIQEILEVVGIARIASACPREFVFGSMREDLTSSNYRDACPFPVSSYSHPCKPTHQELKVGEHFLANRARPMGRGGPSALAASPRNPGQCPDSLALLIKPRARIDARELEILREPSNDIAYIHFCLAIYILL